MLREKDAYKHRGVKGWHHHHGLNGSVPFVHYHDSELYIPYGEDDDAPGKEWSAHYADHDEFQGNEEPCRDKECWFFKGLGA